MEPPPTTRSSGFVQAGADAGGTLAVGGLIGSVGLTGVIDQSSSSASVTGGDGNAAGGLVGAVIDGAAVTDSSASGNVTVGGQLGSAFSYGGGLVGIVYGLPFGGGTPVTTTVTGSHASGSVTGGEFAFIGGFAGGIIAATVDTSYSTGGVGQSAAGASGNNIAGGFVGFMDTGGVVTRSYQSGGAVFVAGGVDASHYTLAGGFVGDLEHGSTISDSYSLGGVFAFGSGFSLAGGFAGDIQSNALVTRVYASGFTGGFAPVAGLAAFLEGGSITNSYWDEGTTGRTNAICCGSGTVSNLVGIGGGTGISPFTAATYGQFDFSATGPWVIIEGATRPMLRSEYSTTITNGHQLQLMALDLTASYTVSQDIDLGNTAGGFDVWNPATGFSPIGGNNTGHFTGSFDGGGHTLSYLMINYTTPVPQTLLTGVPVNGVVGLFGDVVNGGSVRNVNLFNANVTGGDQMYIGALAGVVSGTISNASSSGSVTGGADYGAGGTRAVGGLVGAAGTGGVVDHSSSSAYVVAGDGYAAGGLVGELGDNGHITDSFATGGVSVGGKAGSVFSFGGGLVGLMYGIPVNGGPPVAATVTNSYATGNVSGGESSFVGGFAGGIIQGTVDHSYATGTVSQPFAGATGNNIAGRNSSATWGRVGTSRPRSPPAACLRTAA